MTAATFPETKRAAAPGKAPRPVAPKRNSAKPEDSNRCGVCDSLVGDSPIACAECLEPTCGAHARLTPRVLAGGLRVADVCCTLCANALAEAAAAAREAGACVACTLAFGPAVPCRCDRGTVA